MNQGLTDWIQNGNGLMWIIIGCVILAAIVVLWERSALVRGLVYLVVGALAFLAVAAVGVGLMDPANQARIARGVANIFTPGQVQTSSLGGAPTAIGTVPTARVGGTSPTTVIRPTDIPIELSNDPYRSKEVSQSYPDEEPCKSGAPDKITFKVANSGQQAWAGLKAKLFYGSNADTEVSVPDAQPGATVSVVVNFTCAAFAEGGANDHMLRYLVMTPSGEPMPGGFDWNYTSVP
jgi:hypothetical protein